MIKVIDVHVADIRFPTSSHSDGSDAMNPDPDYSATYVTLITNSAFNGNGLTFTIGRGNELCVAAVHALKFMLINKDLVEICNQEGVRLGVGRADCSAKELRLQIKEQNLAKTSGKAPQRKPVIHRNHLFLE